MINTRTVILQINEVRQETYIRTCARSQDSESSIDAFWIAKDAKYIHADNEDSDQTVRMRRLI